MLSIEQRKAKTNKKLLNSLFLIYFSIMFFGRNMGWGSEDRAYQILAIIAIVGFFIKLIFTKYSLNEFLISSSILLLASIVYLSSGKIAAVFTVITIIGSKNVKIDDWLRSIFYTQLVLLIYNVFLSLTGTQESNYIDHTRILVGQEFNVRRFSFGFDHPNTLHFVIFVLISIYLYRNYHKNTLRHYTANFLINCIAYAFTQSRTGFLVTTALLIMFLFSRKLNLYKFRYILMLTPLLFSFINLFFSYFFSYNSRIMVILDNLVQGRLNYSNYFLTNYPISLFGNEIIYNSWQIIDSSYIELFISYGFLFFCLFNVLYMLLIKNCVNNDNKRMIVIVIAFLLYGNMEVFLPNIFKNFSLIFFSAYLFNGAE